MSTRVSWLIGWHPALLPLFFPVSQCQSVNKSIKQAGFFALGCPSIFFFPFDFPSLTFSHFIHRLHSSCVGPLICSNSTATSRIRFELVRQIHHIPLCSASHRIQQEHLTSTTLSCDFNPHALRTQRTSHTDPPIQRTFDPCPAASEEHHLAVSLR